MSPDNPITLLGDLSKPATTLIEKCSNAIGHCCAPWQTKRMAKAEAEAALIRAEGQIAIDDLQRRAVTRFVEEETAKQQNIDSIVQKALPLVGEDSNPENIDDDWITFFFEKCRIVSDKQMQEAWARVLAGEANEPTSFSKRTLQILSVMGRDDAGIFKALCGCMIEFTDNSLPCIISHRDEIYEENKITFDFIKHIEDTGLINFSASDFFAFYILDYQIISYFGNEYIIKNDKDKNELIVGHCLFTQSGFELSKICQPEPITGFEEYVIKNLQKINKLKIDRI